MLAQLARITRPDLAYESAACAQAFTEAYGLDQEKDGKEKNILIYDESGDHPALQAAEIAAKAMAGYKPAG